MVDEERRVFRSELRPKCVFYCKPILSSLEDGALWKPGRREYLEWIGVLPWWEELLVRRKLDNNLLHRNDFFDLPVEVFDVRGAASDMAPLLSIELQK